MMRLLIKKLYTIARKDIMLSVSILLAVISTFLVPPSMNYLSYIDYKTISCLFCLMVTVKGFENEGVLAAVSNGVIAKVRTTKILYLKLVLICFFSSMVITNDVALIAFVPITISVLKMCGKEDKLALIVILQTVAANIGSSMTPIGNPQNLFIYSRYHMNISSLAVTTLPYVVICGILLTVYCIARKRETVDKIQSSQQIHIDFSKVVKISVLFILALFSVAGVIPYAIAVAVIVICMYIMDRSLLTKVDYGLLLTFIFIFIIVGNILLLPSVADFLQVAVNKTPVITAVVVSQVISNVPTAILLSELIAEPRFLLTGVSIGGLGTMIASMASIISFKYYVKEQPGSIKSYMLKFTLYNAFFLLILLSASHIIWISNF